MISVIHVVAGLRQSSGGPSRTVVQLCDALAGSSQLDVSLLFQDKNGENVVISENTYVSRHPAKSDSDVAIKLGIPAMQLLGNVAQQKQPEIYHLHGMWSPVLHWATQCAHRKQKAIILQPRGMLEPWSLGYKAWKKRIAMSLYQRRDIERASLLVATSEMEYGNLRKLGFKQPVAIIPNGIKLHTVSLDLNKKNNSTAKKALFLSRIHPKKGLLNLIAAWATLKPADWRLVIAGPDEGGHLAEVIAAAKSYGILDTIDFVGEVEGAAKTSIYQSAHLFILPTYSENFGVVVAEALSYGLPVITTRGAPWSDIETFGCGWWINIGKEPLVHALKQALGLTELQLQEMGSRGRIYAERYDWSDIAAKMTSVYSWILGGAIKPDCVRLD